MVLINKRMGSGAVLIHVYCCGRTYVYMTAKSDGRLSFFFFSYEEALSLSLSLSLSIFVAWVRERTIPTERPPLVGKVSGNFCE
jgi:hypothetical protein